MKNAYLDASGRDVADVEDVGNANFVSGVHQQADQDDQAYQDGAESFNCKISTYIAKRKTNY